MTVRCSLGAGLRLSAVTIGIGVLGCGLAPMASAAATAPVSETTCNGSLAKAPTADEPNQLSYKFHCDWGITSYTIAATRKATDFDTLDDFSASPLVVDATGAAVPKTSITCGGSIPGNGVNCATVSGTYIAAPNYVEGTIDTSDPYCANIPSGSPAGTKAEHQALVQLVVTDTRGAEDGPFRLSLTPACGPTPKAAIKKTHRRQTHRKHRKHAQRK